MSVRRNLLAVAMASIIALAMVPASAQTLRYANQGDLKSLDPYTPISHMSSRALPPATRT